MTTQTAGVEDDQDGDGVLNIYDLDDDNDGIPDELECSGLTSSGPVSLINGAFDAPDVDDPNPTYVKSWGSQDKAVLYHEDDVPGWKTTATDHKIEIWESGFGGFQSYAGHQFAEINANQNAALYQDVQSTPEAVMTWSFAHRGRVSSSKADSIRLLIGPPGGPYVEQGRFGTTNSAWALYKGIYKVPAGQTTTRYLYEAISTANGNASMGNFLDAIRFYSSDVNCPINTDGDSLVNSLDLDSDDDGIADLVEAGGEDQDWNGIADDLTDTDGDGLVDMYDTDMTDGPLVSGCELGIDCDLSGSTSSLFDKDMDGQNEENGDFDEDGLPNWTDLDSDADGILDAAEIDSLTYTAGYYGTPIDFDGDTQADYLDIDADDDGIIDLVEGQPTLGFVPPSGQDLDTDGLDDSFDEVNGFGGSGVVPVNTDSKARPDFQDLDSDDDQVSDEVEAYDLDGDGLLDLNLDGKGKRKNKDKDKDGLDDGWDKNENKKDATNGADSPLSFPKLSGTSDPSWRNIGGQFPVEWLSFDGQLQAQGVALSWSTASELNSDYFEVQRSYDGEMFEDLGRVTAGGTAKSTQAYQYLDTKPLSPSQKPISYRLKQVDLDGSFEYSKRIEIQLIAGLSELALTAYPNPTSGPVTLRWSDLGEELVSAAYQVMDLSGRTLEQGMVNWRNGYQQLNLSALTPGTYLVQISHEKGVLSTRVVKK